MRFLGIQNMQAEGFGRFDSLLAEMGVQFDCFRAFEGQALPAPDPYDAILIGGTPVAAYELESHPFLVAEERYLRAVVEGGQPCLGVCFGAQLLAKILGAGVRRAPRKEIGVYPLALTEAGRADPLLRGFPGRFQVFQWHGDTFDIPAGAELLAAGEDCPNQMFRRGSAAGVQFHLETTPGEAAVWARVYADEVRQFGRPPEELLAEIRRHEPAARELAERFVHNLVGWVGALQGR
ncbi:MAG TPA: type 1 glutamine amidotransferase [Candidatus Saccharimonadales bacterium]|nr:type 1 glutamine amidotransferase [Candidatus Saccharimonadales bacterium]